MSKKMTIGLMMVVRNEAKHIKDCLVRNMPYVDQISIIDQSSTDRTVEIMQNVLKDYKHKYHIGIDKNWGYCEPSKQKAADYLQTDWILYIDPDEEFPINFLENMHDIVLNASPDTCNGFLFPRYNFFHVKVFDENVPIKPKWITFQHPAKDPQLRLTRKIYSVFPPYLHNRVRIFNEKGEKLMMFLPYPIDHHKTILEQWEDQNRYKIVNDAGHKKK